MDIYYTIIKCKLCDKVVQERDKGIHLVQHIEQGDIWHRRCKIDGKPMHGYCLSQKQYEICQSKNNWMCWREGILTVYTADNLDIIIKLRELE